MTNTKQKPQPTQCFADMGKLSMIDLINPETGCSCIQGENLEQIRLRYPNAQVVNINELIAKKVAAQDSEPRTWTPTTEEHYWDMLNVLPPAAQHRGAFLVGEASDHHADTGRPRFACFKQENEQFFELSGPITHAKFCELFGRCAYTYSE